MVCANIAYDAASYVATVFCAGGGVEKVVVPGNGINTYGDVDNELKLMNNIAFPVIANDVVW